MAHVIDFTLFYGGVASAPAAELPFAGSSFDVQVGTARRAVFGTLEVESVAFVDLEAVRSTAPELGLPALDYAAQWEGAGGIRRSASFGAVSVSVSIELPEVGAGAHAAALGVVSVAAGVELGSLTVGAKAAELGGLTVGSGVELNLTPVSRSAEFGAASVSNGVTLDTDGAGERVAAFGAYTVFTSVELGGLNAGYRTAVMGAVSVATGVELDGLTAEARAAGLGGLTVATVVDLALASVEQSAVLGSASVLNAVTLDVGSVSKSTASFGSYAVSNGVELGGLSAGARKPSLGTTEAYSVCAVGMDAVPEQETFFGELAALQAVTVTLDGFSCEASFGAYSLATSAEVDMAGVGRKAELGTATVLNALSLDVAGIGVRSGIGTLAVYTGVELAGLKVGACEAGFGSVDAWTEIEVQVDAVLVQDMAVGLPVAYSVSHVDAESVSAISPVVNNATAVSGLTLGMGGHEHDEPVLGSLTVSCWALVEADGVGRASMFGAPSIFIEVFPDSVRNEVVFGQPVAHSVCHVEVESVPDSSARIGGAVFYSAVTLDFSSVADTPAEISKVAVYSAALAVPESVVLESAFGSPSIVIEVFPSGFACEEVFGHAMVYSGCFVGSESVAEESALVGGAEFYSAVTLDFASIADRIAEAGHPEVTCGALVESDGFEHMPSLGTPAIVIEVFPAGVARIHSFGEVTTWRSSLAEPESVADVPAQVGRAEFYSAVTLDFASVADVSADAGKPVVTTASFVEPGGVCRVAVLGKPSIMIEAFPASVVRQPAVGAAAFISAKETALSSVPGTPAQVNGADFVSVALVRPAGIAAGSVAMGGGVDVETTALAMPASLELRAAFGQPDLAVIIRPDSLVHECSIGGADLIPAHTADMAAFVRTAVFGTPDVGFGLLVEPEGVKPRGHAFGSPAYSWRKCPRWDLLARLQKEAEFGAEIRPAPVAAQVWRGEGCVCRARAIEAMVMRWTDLHTIARPKNAMDAAVRRKEQI